MNKIAILFISNQLSDETLSRIIKIRNSINNLNTNNEYEIFWCYDKEDEYYSITSSNNIKFYICTHDLLKNKYGKIFYNWNNNFNVSLMTCSFVEDNPDYDYIWTIEDDVVVKNNYWEFLFNGFDNNISDLLGAHIGYYNKAFFDKKNHLSLYYETKWCFDYNEVVKKYNIVKWLTAFLPINRLSKNAVLFINEYFRNHNGFFEILIPTLLYNNGYVIEDISNPYSEFTKKENYNKYYIVQNQCYKNDFNNSYSTISYTQKFVGSIDDIPTGVLMHPIKWFDSECDNQELINLKNNDDKLITHYIAYHDEKLLNDKIITKNNVDYYCTSEDTKNFFTLNHLNSFISEFAMFYSIWKYDNTSEYISTNHYRRIFNLELLDYEILNVNSCIIESYINIPNNIKVQYGNTFGIHNWTKDYWMNCEWLWEDMQDYLNINYGKNNIYIIEDYKQDYNKLFIPHSCFIMHRSHFNNLCQYIFGFLDYLNTKYDLQYDYDKYHNFILDKFILPNKGRTLPVYGTEINENNTNAYRILSLLFEWMVSIYITSHFNEIYLAAN